MHGSMMIHVGIPGPVERNEPPCVHRSAEHVLWDKISFIPQERLIAQGSRGVFPLSHAIKPIPIRVVAVFEPFVD
jgi:hypothetical protein